MNIIFKFTFLLVIVVAVAVGVGNTFAQTEEQIARQEQILQAEMARIEKEIAANRLLLSGKQQETASISRDVDILNYQINQARLNIRAKQIEIQRLGGDINDREEYIGVLSEKREEDKQSLAELLRKTRQLDDISLLEIVLENNSLSDVFADLDSFSSIQNSMMKSFAQIRNNQSVANEEKETLRVRRDGELEAKIAIEAETRIIEQKEREKQRLLNLSKSEESNY